MKFKSLTVYLLVSSIFLLCLLSILKIMSTLQGIDFTNLNISQNFILGICLSLGLLVIGNKLNHFIKIFSFTSVFTIFYLYINESAPIWYNVGILLICLFFTNRLKNYDLNLFLNNIKKRVGNPDITSLSLAELTETIEINNEGDEEDQQIIVPSEDVLKLRNFKIKVEL